MTPEDTFPEDFSKEDRLLKARQFLANSSMKLRDKFEDFERLLDSLPVRAPVTIENDTDWQMIRWIIAHSLAKEAEAQHDREREEDRFDFSGIDRPTDYPDQGGD